MSNWNPNNRSCTTLWTTLFKMKQLNSSFDESGSLKMSDLLYFNPLGSAAEQLKTAKILADQLDVVFRIGRGAVYEEGMDHSSSMQQMKPILISGEKLVEDLAEVTDIIYRFWEESSSL